MTKGTASRGKRGKTKTHVICARCGSKSYNHRKDVCASCGFGRGPKIKNRPQGKNR